MYGPKGILDFKLFLFSNKDGMTTNNPRIADKKRTNGIDCQPNNNPTPAISFASPMPIPFRFFESFIKIDNDPNRKEACNSPHQR